MDIATIPAGVQTLETFTFDNTVALAAGAHYGIALRYLGGDSMDYLSMSLDPTSPTHPGNVFYGSHHDAGSDFVFYLYETPPAPPVTSTSASSAWSVSLLVLMGLGLAIAVRRRAASY